jgi:hypothetical protein
LNLPKDPDLWVPNPTFVGVMGLITGVMPSGAGIMVFISTWDG